jgi:outer membrane protein assembly factor BamB
MLFPVAISLTFAASALGDGPSKTSGNWPQFRGPGASGVADGRSLPTEWDLESDRNIKWTTPIDGLAHSSPIVWADRIYVTTAISGEPSPELKVGLYGSGDSAADRSEQRWMLIGLDKRTGEILWQREGHRGAPSVARHTKATYCNSTPATDGERIVTFFGSEGLFCFDMDGSPLWKKDLGRLEGGPLEFDTMEWGFASSPVICDGRVFVQCDVHDQAFVAAFDAHSGKQLWRTDRQEVPTWCTPTVYRHAGRARLAVNGFKHIGGYDCQTGREVWRLAGGGDVPVPTPVESEGLLFITNAHGAQRPLYAIRTSALGDLSEAGESARPHMAWSTMDNGAYMQTPLVYRGRVYSCSDRGVLKCYDAATGKLIYEQRLGKGMAGFTASPVAGDGKIYFANEEGDVYVVRAAGAFDALATNALNDICMATPAISDGVIYFRMKGRLIAVGG